MANFFLMKTEEKQRLSHARADSFDLRAVMLIVALTVALTLPGPAAAGTQIDGGLVGDIAGYKALGYPGQRKLVRDNSGYWYAVWGSYYGSQHQIYMNKSTNTSGTAWNTPVKLVGTSGILRNTANQLYYPSIDIDRVNNKIHLVWQEGTTDLFYSKLVDLSNWNNGSYWKSVQESYTGAQVIDASNATAADASLAPSIVVAPSGGPLVLFFKSASGRLMPFIKYAQPLSDFNSVLYLYGSTDRNFAYGSIDVDSGGRAYVAARRDTENDIVYWTIDSPYTAKTGPTNLIGPNGNSLKFTSTAVDGYGKVHVATLEETDNAVWTAHFNGSGWAVTQDMDSAGWQNPDVGVKQGAGVTDHIILAPASGAVPNSLYYWKWSGSAWGQPETDTGEDADGYASLEQHSQRSKNEIGYLYFDENGSTDRIYFATITGLDTGPLDPLVAYTEYNGSTDDILRYRKYASAAWGAEADAYDTNDSGALRWHVAATSADGKKQAVVAVGTGSNTLYAALFDGTSWRTTDLGAIYTSNYRCFGAAYEQQSGQLLIAAATSTTNQINTGCTTAAPGWSTAAPIPSMIPTAFIRRSTGSGWTHGRVRTRSP